jgi:hypothetical protein
MIEYAASYQYYLSPELRHTLFVGELYSLIGIGYPEGWIETLDSEDNRLMLPEGATYENSPAVRVYRASPDEIELIPTWYDLDEDYDFSLNPITPFEANGRQGYIVFAGYGNSITLIEVSAPSAVFDEYGALLESIANAAWVKPVTISR